MPLTVAATSSSSGRLRRENVPVGRGPSPVRVPAGSGHGQVHRVGEDGGVVAAHAALAHVKEDVRREHADRAVVLVVVQLLLLMQLLPPLRAVGRPPRSDGRDRPGGPGGGGREQVADVDLGLLVVVVVQVAVVVVAAPASAGHRRRRRRRRGRRRPPRLVWQLG